MSSKYEYIVNNKDMDFTCRASLISMCDYVLQAAGEDAHSQGFGVDYLKANSMAWVLSRMSLEMYRYPNKLEKFYIETWVEKVDKVIATRHFNIKSLDNELLGVSVTFWSIINYDSRRMVDCRQFNLFADCMSDEKSKIADPERIRSFEGELVASAKVKYSHLDFNQHTTTTKYLAWMLNAISIEKYEKSEPSRADFNFISESRYNDTILIYNKRNIGDDLFMLCNEDTNKNICTAKITWRDR